MSKLQAIAGVQGKTFMWTGGLDFSSSPESISSECLTRADNAEYSVDGALKKADGIVPVFTSGAVDMAWPFNGYTIYNNGLNLYRVDLTAATPSDTLIGTLAGSNLNKQSFCMRDTSLLIASGGQLQKLDTSWNLTTDTNSPYCDRVFIDNGRIMVTLTSDTGGTDSDYRYYCAITDDTVWDLSPLPEQRWTSTDDYTTTALFQEIGYRDGLNIIDVQQLGSDYIFTKSDGKIFKQYRATGFLNTWNVVDLKPSISVIDAVGAINDIYTIGLSGFNSFLTVQQYGDIKKDETGKKVNIQLSGHVTQDAKVWHLPLKKQIIVKIANDKVLWIYHYNQRNAATGEIGAWTKRILSADCYHVWEDGNISYIAMGSKLCRFDATSATQDGNNFSMRCAGKRFVTSFLFNLIHYSMTLKNNISGAGSISIGGLSESLTFQSGDDIAAEDDDIAFDNDDIAAGNVDYERDLYFECPLTKDFILELSCSSGSIEFRTFAIDYSEV